MNTELLKISEQILDSVLEDIEKRIDSLEHPYLRIVKEEEIDSEDADRE